MQIPFGDDNQKGKNKSKGKSKSRGKGKGQSKGKKAKAKQTWKEGNRPEDSGGFCCGIDNCSSARPYSQFELDGPVISTSNGLRFMLNVFFLAGRPL
jgi:hypothetical protein